MRMIIYNKNPNCALKIFEFDCLAKDEYYDENNLPKDFGERLLENYKWPWCKNWPNRWPEIEPYIITNPKAANDYAHYILHKRWFEAEKYIKENNHEFYVYCVRFGIDIL